MMSSMTLSLCQSLENAADSTLLQVNIVIQSENEKFFLIQSEHGLDCLHPIRRLQNCLYQIQNFLCPSCRREKSFLSNQKKAEDNNNFLYQIKRRQNFLYPIRRRHKFSVSNQKK